MPNDGLEGELTTEQMRARLRRGLFSRVAAAAAVREEALRARLVDYAIATSCRASSAAARATPAL